MTASGDIFSSLNAPKAICSLVPPGKCQFTPEFSPCKLLQHAKVTDTTSLLRFALPDETQPLNLSTCACILAKAQVAVAENGDEKKGEGEEEVEATTSPKKRKEDVIRPYTPISTNAQIGSFDLLIKVRSFELVMRIDL